MVFYLLILMPESSFLLCSHRWICDYFVDVVLGVERFLVKSLSEVHQNWGGNTDTKESKEQRRTRIVHHWKLLRIWAIVIKKRSTNRVQAKEIDKYSIPLRICNWNWRFFFFFFNVNRQFKSQYLSKTVLFLL